MPDHIDIQDWRSKPKIDRHVLIADLVNAVWGDDNDDFFQSAIKLENSYQLVKHLSDVIPYADEVTLYQIVKAQVRKHMKGRGIKRIIEPLRNDYLNLWMIACMPRDGRHLSSRWH